jgi:hypothetical protein
MNPTRPTKTCGCERNEVGDICCHVCGQRVNVKCWNCGTIRAEGPCPNPKEAPVDPTCPICGKRHTANQDATMQEVLGGRGSECDREFAKRIAQEAAQ